MADEADTTAELDDAATADVDASPNTADAHAPAQAAEDTDAGDKTDWKAMARKHEARAKENAAAAKELAALKKSQMSDQEKAQATAKEATDRAEAAERRAALLEAAVTHSLTKDELELLEDTPVDKVDARAKKLAALRKTAKTGSSGGEATGSRGPQKPTSLSGAIAAHYNQ